MRKHRQAKPNSGGSGGPAYSSLADDSEDSQIGPVSTAEYPQLADVSSRKRTFLPVPCWDEAVLVAGMLSSQVNCKSGRRANRFYRYLVPDVPSSEDGIALAALEEGTSVALDLEGGVYSRGI